MQTHIFLKYIVNAVAVLVEEHLGGAVTVVAAELDGVGGALEFNFRIECDTL